MTQGDPGDSLFMSSWHNFPAVLSKGFHLEASEMQSFCCVTCCWQAFFGNCRSATEFASHLQFRRGDRKQEGCKGITGIAESPQNAIAKVLVTCSESLVLWALILPQVELLAIAV